MATSKKAAPAQKAVSKAITAETGTDRLVKVVTLIGEMRQTITQVCVDEIRQKATVLNMTPELSAECMFSDAEKAFRKKSRIYNAQRMMKFASELVTKGTKLKVMLLDFPRQSDGKKVADCLCFKIEDQSTVDTLKYVPTYSGTYTVLWNYFMTVWLDNPELALETLNSDTAAADLARLYQEIKEREASEEQDGKPSKGEGEGAGAVTTATLDPEAADEVKEIWNVCDQIMRLARDGVHENPLLVNHLPDFHKVLGKVVRDMVAIIDGTEVGFSVSEEEEAA